MSAPTVHPSTSSAPPIEEEKRRHPEKGVFLKADARLEYGQARRVMDAIHAAGVEDVQLGTDEASTSDKSSGKSSTGAAQSP